MPAQSLKGSTAFGKMHLIRDHIGDTPALTFHRVLVVNENGQFETLLLTLKELDDSRKRMKRQPDDVLEPTFIDRMRAL